MNKVPWKKDEVLRTLKLKLSTAHPDAGPVPLYEMHRIHQASEPKCCMCMNLTNDSVYAFPCGHHFCKSCTQHPNPGQPYSGLFCTAYLPDNSAGQELLNLLRRAFDARLIFTIGKCHATGEENRIVWNGIELKTSRSGGPANRGYPDPSYLDRVKSQLTEKGITQPQDESPS
ncbi:E3 ubiquitin-protein ligase dtx3l [Desmophyllum pertusum]|uniref:E3 ubiquitin-protein ligase n=1 Tax=Desmophyllum pertusum TaxID=174260 RepID=A0A9W9Z4C6_9CNID|nr:E3 ubiquitin-protein ligase dtx3l [Desmophyllum pertusum]